MLIGSQVGSIAGGGRYDGLIGMFSGKSIPAVGGSIGIERIFNILEAKYSQNNRIRQSQTLVLVCTIGNNLAIEKLKLVNELRKANTARLLEKYDYPIEEKLREIDNLKNELLGSRNAVAELERRVSESDARESARERDIERERERDILPVRDSRSTPFLRSDVLSLPYVSPCIIALPNPRTPPPSSSCRSRRTRA